MIETAKTLARGNPWALQVWYEALSDEEQAALWTALGIDAVQQAIERLAEIWEQICDVILAAAQAIVEWCKAFFSALFEPVQRGAFYCRLCRWHVPHWFALWLAQCWPRRWLGDAR